MSDRQRNGFILLLVAGLLAASLFAIATQKTRLGLDLKGGVELTYQGLPTKQTPTVTQEALQRAVDIMRERIDQLGVSEPEIQTLGGNEIDVGLPAVKDFARAEKQVGTTAQLAFYDWEANVLTPNGKTAASQLQAQDPTALTLSQGSGSPPGNPGSGSVPLYDAVKLASTQPSAGGSVRLGPEYYMFGAPGSQACATAAKQQGKTPTPGVHCLLSGPDDNRQDLLSGLPTGVSASEAQELVVPQGTIVVQAADSDGRQDDQLQRSERAVLRAQGPRLAARLGHLQSPAEHRPGRQPGRHVRLQRLGRTEVPVRHPFDRPARPARERPRPDAPPSISRWRSTASSSRCRRSTTSSTPTASPVTKGRTSRAASRSPRRPTWPTCCASARCRSSSS